MVYGPMGGGQTGQAERRLSDPFSFSQDAMMSTGFGAFALFWAAPWRAAFVIADEALREGLRERR